MLSALCATAQSSTTMQDFFTQVLEGKKPQPIRQKIALKELPSWRDKVWAAWRAANVTLSEPKLKECPDTLGPQTASFWQLPDSLEPNARLNYYWGSKGDEPAQGYPLYIYLHGSGPRDREWSTGLLLARRWCDAPSVYFIPQIPQEGEWYRWWQRSKQFAWERLLRQALLNPHIDPRRIYVLGISEGGYGSQRLASFYADYWAGAGPMAGGEPLPNAPAENLRHTPFSFLTGAVDEGFYRNILTRATASALDSLRSLYAHADSSAYIHRIELIPGKGHHIDYSPTTPWLSQFRRNAPHPALTWEDYEMDGRRRNGFGNLEILQRPDGRTRTRYEMRTEGNNIFLSVDNVKYTVTEKDPRFGITLRFERTYTKSEGGAVRIYLSEDMVNLKKDVTIYVNGKKRFSGRLYPNVESMLGSVSTFYDPLRIFPAFVDVTY